MMSRKTFIYLAFLGVFVLIFGFGLIIYPHSAFTMTGKSLEAPNFEHWLGTDNLGVDIFAQLSFGFFYCLLVGMIAAALTFLLGGVIGILSGYFGGVVDLILSAVINFFLAVPQLPVMVLIGAFWGQSLLNIILIVSVFSWARIAKIIRAKTISVRQQEYITISQKYGGSFFYVFWAHLKRELLPLLCMNSVAVIGKAIVQESSLAFLGLSDPSSKSWGLMINKAISFKGIYFTNYWTWWLLSPLFSLVLTIFIIRLIVRELEQNMLGKSEITKKRGSVWKML